MGSQDFPLSVVLSAFPVMSLSESKYSRCVRFHICNQNSWSQEFICLGTSALDHPVQRDIRLPDQPAH